MKNIEKILGLLMLLFAIGFNLWIYRVEPTAKVDPNDNHFQYALVDRTDQIWDFANKTCPSAGWRIFSLVTCRLSLLIDHWVPNWAEGYNLPYYYSHLPQIAIVGSYRLLTFLSKFSIFNFQFSLFQYYHVVIYLLLSLFPLSMFVALRVIQLSWLTAGLGALIASQISTDGFYGLDPASFLWRGYGLSSQLFAMMWLPLAIAYAWRLFSRNSKLETRNSLIPAVFFLAATTAGHLGIGIIAFLSVGVLALTTNFGKNIGKLFWILGCALLLLAYWIVPAYLQSNFHNFSVWDPIWKFNSYGANEVLTRLLNGNLFDFGHFPILTILVLIGFFALLTNQVSGLVSFALLFIFWLLLYFGRTTWGGLIDLIPTMSEFHLSRMIVGVHLAGLFLIPIGVEWIVSGLMKYIRLPARHRYARPQRLRLAMSGGAQAFAGGFVYVLIGLFVYLIIAPQTIRYAAHNDFLIKRANSDYQKVESDVSLLLNTLHQALNTKPGRVFAGRGGSWGKDFRVAETPYFMHLSTYGIPTVLWMPETWSPNSDTEQFFNETRLEDYALYNIRYVVTPPKQDPQPFWKLHKETKSWKLYEVSSSTSDVKASSTSEVNRFGYITGGVRPAIVSSSKENFINVVHLWIQSDAHKQGLYPELTFDSQYPKDSGLPNFRMLDEVTYKVPDGSTHNLFSEIPRYVASDQCNNGNNLPTGEAGITILSQESESDMIFRAKIEVKNVCPDTVVVLRQTFHPSWQATIDGKPAQTMTVFPFFTAVKLESPGTHEVVFSYQPSMLKLILLAFSAVSFVALGILTFKQFNNGAM